MNWTRRELLKAALALPGGACLARYEALAAPLKNKVKITGIKAMQLRHNGGDCLIKIETDAGLVGYGEAGGTGAIVRARLQTIQRMLIGRDPLEIERHFHNMSTMTHTYIAHIPTVSGIDIALWDLAGKILEKPVYTLLGGPFRDRIPITETVFNWPGVGRLYVEATTKLDFPLIMGITVFITLMTLFANLITDLTYAYIDPRIRVE